MFQNEILSDHVNPQLKPKLQKLKQMLRML